MIGLTGGPVGVEFFITNHPEHLSVDLGRMFVIR